MSNQTLPDAAPEAGRQMFRLVDTSAATKAKDSAGGGGCGCGGKGRAHRSQGAGSERASGGCGCGGHGPDSAPQAISIDTLPKIVAHDIPVATRKETLFAALDALEVGAAILLEAPHRPEPIFEHLEDSEAHYRIQTVEEGPATWRYVVSRRA